MIPTELRSLAQWVAWQNEDRGGKPAKVPKNPATGGNASTTNRATWGTYEAAIGAVVRYKFAGVGFVFSSDDDFFGIDMDACRNPDTGELTPWAQEIVDAFTSYTDVSPSKFGVKIVARGRIPASSRKVKKLTRVPTFGNKSPEIAIYDRFAILVSHWRTARRTDNV